TTLPGSVTLDGLTFSAFDGLNFTGTLTLASGPVTLNSNGSNISVASLVAGGQNLILASGIGAGTTTFTNNVANLGSGTGAALTVQTGVTGLVDFQGTLAANSGLVAATGTSLQFDHNVTLANGDTATNLAGHSALA